MKPTTRKRLLRYGIPIDLVLLATGVGFLAPRIDPLALIAVYFAAVALSAWKSGWRGGLTAAILGMALLFALFSGSVRAEQIGWFAGASALVSLLFSKRDARRRPRPAFETPPGPPQLAPVIAMQRPTEEVAAEVVPPPIDDRWVIERETRARAEGERIASERFVIEKANIEERVAGTRAQFEREHTERFERDRAGLQAAYDRERASLKASFDAARLELDAERADLQKQLEEARRAPPVVAAHIDIDEDALAQRLEQLRAELQQQFDRELQPRIDAQLAAQREALDRDAVQEIEKIRSAAEDRVATFRAELERALAVQAAAVTEPARRRRSPPSPPLQKSLFRRLFNRRSHPPAKRSRRSSSGDNTASRRAEASLAESSAQKTAAETAVIAEPEAARAVAEGYEVHCFNCDVAFDAIEADWCSCLTSDRTVVCTNCLTCFCKAAPSYKEKFWMAAPRRLVDRKPAGQHSPAIVPNPPPDEVKRPLVMLVEDDEDIQAIVQRVCANLGYGFVSAANGQDGLSLARIYRPNLILSDAFTPRLDGREMCRLLKEDPMFATTKMVVLTGLYTDTKYRSEAIRRFHVDDYLAKPVSITDLISLLQRHIEGVVDLPAQENLHELHRKEIEAAAGEERPGNATTYEVGCATCGETFDAAKAGWCAGPGPDRTLVCEHCGNCFCEAPAAYQHRFWIEAPSVLFERKMIVADRESDQKNPAPPEAKRPLILLVENDESIQLIVRTVVTTMGYGFIAGANGEEGHALARQYSPDLIVSDAFLPKRDGRELYRLLKEDPATARTKVIMMTGLYADPVFRKEALSQFNADDYLPKPLVVDDVIQLLKKHVPQEVQEIAPRPARIITNT
ncbi:MAG: response regulator [Acidobacteriota bacterium]|nr:response regulator [Acidobacteriota bacterium]